MSDVVIKIEKLSKQYRLGTIGTGTLSHDLNRLFAKIQGKQDPYLKIGESNDRSRKGGSDYVWALKDINFEVKRGEILGVIGRNGAGKSTLLKILSQITRPTTGSVKMKGRVGSLLEVGTGFHPELTGKENIYINGAILGMRKWEIDKKLEEIIDFAGVERYIDTPVKRYSSGMKVRLGFSVAAHLEPEILIIDEVLAVGDMEFQNKAISKMKGVTASDGCTLIFVSHDLNKIEMLTKRCLLMKAGELFIDGNTSTVISEYNSIEIKENNYIAKGFEKANYIQSVYLSTNKVFVGDSLKIEVNLDISVPLVEAGLSIQIINSKEIKVLHFLVLSKEIEFAEKPGKWQLILTLPKVNLYPDKYFLKLSLGDNVSKTNHDRVSNICLFEVVVPEHLLRDYFWYPGEAVCIGDNSWDVSYEG